MENLDKTVADDLVFGENKHNYKNKNFGVIDLKPRIEETNSSKVKVKGEDVKLMIERIKTYRPRNICIIHKEVMKHFKRATGVELRMGHNGRIFKDLNTEFYCNYFPNGNNIPTRTKVEIYRVLGSNL